VMMSKKSENFSAVKIETLSEVKTEHDAEIAGVSEIAEGLSHQQMQSLTDYSLSNVRSRASLGKIITAKDGFNYHYDKDPKTLKWVRI